MNAVEAPIQNVDAFDIVGRRNDGGVDLVVVCSGPLDESAQTLDLLDLKVRNYLREIASAHFRHEFGASKISIFLSCAHPVSPKAKQRIAALESEARSRNVGLHLVKEMP